MEKTKPPHCQNYISQNNIKLSDCNILIMCSSHRVDIYNNIKEKIDIHIYVYLYRYICITFQIDAHKLTSFGSWLDPVMIFSLV